MYDKPLNIRHVPGTDSEESLKDWASRASEGDFEVADLKLNSVLEELRMDHIDR